MMDSAKSPLGPGPVLNGTARRFPITLLQAFVAFYAGFFMSFALYEFDKGLTDIRVMAFSAAPVPRPPVRGNHDLTATTVVGRVLAGDRCIGIWIDRTSLPRNRRECAELLDRLRDIGVNAIFPETLSRTAAVCYESAIAPRDEDFNDGSDILRTLIGEAHARNIEVHAWCWCLCAGTAYKPGPQVMKHQSWLAVDRDGQTVSDNGTFWLCPHGEGMSVLTRELIELASSYDLDGINLDYIRIEENDKNPFCMCDRCREDFFGFADQGKPVVWPPSPRNPDFLRWREGILDGFVRELSARIHRIRPGLALSACVLPLERAARRLEGQNWTGWLTDGYLDFACALTYTNRTSRTKRWNSLIAEYRRRDLNILPSVGLHLCRRREELAATLLADCISADLGGVMLFSLKDIPPAVERTLQTGVPLHDTELASLDDGGSAPCPGVRR